MGLVPGADAPDGDATGTSAQVTAGDSKMPSLSPVSNKFPIRDGTIHCLAAWLAILSSKLYGH